MKKLEIFEIDGKEIRIDIYEGYANWYAADADNENPEEVITKGRDSRTVWNKINRLGYRWVRTFDPIKDFHMTINKK